MAAAVPVTHNESCNRCLHVMEKRKVTRPWRTTLHTWKGTTGATELLLLPRRPRRREKFKLQRKKGEEKSYYYTTINRMDRQTARYRKGRKASSMLVLRSLKKKGAARKQ